VGEGRRWQVAASNLGYDKQQAEWLQRALHEYRGGNMRLDGLAIQLERGELEASGNMEHC